MHIIVVGLNYKTAPVEIREKVSFELGQLPEAMKSLSKKKVSLKISLFPPVIGQRFMQ